MSQIAKELIFEEEAREKLKEGIEKLAEVSGVTLGPKGRNVGLQASYGAPQITNDGNSIVKEIELKDQYANMGVAMGKEVAAKMKEKCGDGTTTSILLLKALVQGGVKNIASGSSPIHIKRGMEKTVEALLKEIKAMAIAIRDDKEMLNNAIVAASGDAAVGSVIAEALKKVGKEGVITIEEGKSAETSIEIVEGMQLDRGYLSSYFCTNAETMTAEMSQVKVLVTDKKITAIHDLLPILQSVATTGSELLLIADDIESDALSTLVVNRLRGILKVCAIKAPGFGAHRKALLEDIALLTGAQLISEEAGDTLKDLDGSVLGSADKITVSKEKTVIVISQADSKAVASRILQIENEIKATSSSYDKEKLEERKAKLQGGVVVVKVGALSEPEMKQKKQVFQDCLSATKAALEQGVVVGAGMALLRASQALKKESLLLSKEEEIGYDIVVKACEAPAKQIIANCGHDPLVVLSEALSKGPKFGFNAQTEAVEDLIEQGITDPAKIAMMALTFAASTAAIVLLSEVLIGNAEEETV